MFSRYNMVVVYTVLVCFAKTTVSDKAGFKVQANGKAMDNKSKISTFQKLESDRSHDEARYRLPDNYVTLKPITDNRCLIFVNPEVCITRDHTSFLRLCKAPHGNGCKWGVGKFCRGVQQAVSGCCLLYTSPSPRD